jgi:DnaK suppressor protein
MITEEDRNRIEGRLKEERELAIQALEEFDRTTGQPLGEQAGELSVYRFHMADLGSEAMEQEKQFLLASNEGRRLYRIDEALRRLYAAPETFGRCARCGKPIELERLEVIPYAEHCAQCQRELEAA